MPKSGTTSLQAFLAANAAALAAQGFAYPTGEGFARHAPLALYARDWKPSAESRDQFFSQNIRSPEDLEAFRVALRPRFEAAMQSVPAAVHTVIVSCENAAVLEGEELARLRALLAPHAETIEVLAYYRRQDRYALSAYSTHLRNGGQGDLLAFMQSLYDFPLLKYDRVADGYAAVFGGAAIVPRVIEEAAGAQEDIVEIFCREMGSDTTGLTPTPPENTSLDTTAQRFLEGFNRVYPVHPSGAERLGLARLMTVLYARFSGPGQRPPRAEAERLLAHFEPHNERFRQIWLPARDRLFDDDLSAYAGSRRSDPAADDPHLVVAALLEAWGTDDLDRQAERRARRRKRHGSKVGFRR